MKTVKQRILAGFLNRNEVMTQAQGLTAVKDAAGKQEIWKAFKRAHEYRSSLAPKQIPRPSMVPLPESANGHLSAVEGTDAFQEAFGGTSYSFLSVGLDALQPVQIFTNVQPQMSPPAIEDEEGLLKYCLPIDPTIPAEAMITPAGVRFSTNRYGHGPQNVRRRLLNGHVALTFEHPNLLQICNVTGTVNGQSVNRMVILNGNHRALELMNAGHKTAPALVIQAQNPGAIPWWPQGPGFWNPDFILLNPRPALLSDFLTPMAIECPCVLVPSIVDINVGVTLSPAPQGQPMAIQLKPGA